MNGQSSIVLLIGASHAAFAARCAREIPSIRAVVLEHRSVSLKLRLLRRRVRKLGIGTVMGQVACRLLRPRQHTPLASPSSAQFPDYCQVLKVKDINSAVVSALLRQLKPDRAGVYGTSILKGELLDALPPDCVNLHGGLTQFYRGQAASFWAIHDGHPERVGFTLHTVDRGIDTGSIIHCQACDVAAVNAASSIAEINDLVAATGEAALLTWLRQGSTAFASNKPSPSASQQERGKYFSEPTWSEYRTMQRKSKKR